MPCRLRSQATTAVARSERETEIVVVVAHPVGMPTTSSLRSGRSSIRSATVSRARADSGRMRALSKSNRIALTITRPSLTSPLSSSSTSCCTSSAGNRVTVRLFPCRLLCRGGLAEKVDGFHLLDLDDIDHDAPCALARVDGEGDHGFLILAARQDIGIFHRNPPQGCGASKPSVRRRKL